MSTVNQQLLDYINQQKQQGISPDAIKIALRSNGWMEVDITQAFDNNVVPQNSTSPVETVQILKPQGSVTSRNKLPVVAIIVVVLLLLAGLVYAIISQTASNPSPAETTTSSPIIPSVPTAEKSTYLMNVLKESTSFYAYRKNYSDFCLISADPRLSEAESAMVSVDGKPSYGNDGPLAGVRNYLCNDSKEGWAATVPTPKKNFVCIDSTGAYVVVATPLVSGQTSCSTIPVSTQSPVSATNNVATYRKQEQEWLTSNQSKELAEGSFASNVSSMAIDIAAKCDQWPLTNEVVTAIKNNYVTIGSVAIIKQNCGRGTPATFELEVLPQKGIIDCKATIMTEAVYTLSGCSTPYLNRQ